jgi:hypothetical protein
MIVSFGANRIRPMVNRGTAQPRTGLPSYAERPLRTERTLRLKVQPSFGGQGGILQWLSEGAAFLMHCFTQIVGFGGLEIDRLVANRAEHFRFERICHTAILSLMWEDRVAIL